MEYCIIDIDSNEKQTLISALGALISMLPIGRIAITEQIKNTDFAAGVLCGLSFSLSANHVPDKIEDKKYNRALMVIIEEIVAVQAKHIQGVIAVPSVKKTQH